MGVEGEAGARTDRSAARHGTDDAEMSAVSGVHAEQYAAVMLATTSDGVWAFDRDGRILEVNEAYCRMSGYSREELLSMRIAELEAIQSETEIAQHICRCMEAGFIRFESRHRAKDGQLFDVEVSAGYAPDQGRFVLFAR